MVVETGAPGAAAPSPGSHLDDGAVSADVRSPVELWPAAAVTVDDTDEPESVVPRRVRLRRLAGGTRIVRGTGEVHGDRGRLVSYSVEVHRSLVSEKRRAAELHEHVERVFGDLERGWTARGLRRMQRVGVASRADIRIVLARPRWVNQVCGRKGMRTASRFSCWTGTYAALNLRRWREGSEVGGFASLDQYRTYLINHEVGHGLDYRHRDCPRRGTLAPVMVPQSRSLYGCRANGWPYP
jgi:hypothetical protein